ncbi:hypothetical protein OGAPHI_000057 [Ogataea philodendri]|uniref:Uncharacterized protein n=1 Tax=Ogataea philodendri TaxID=1378263 RepID=A0A9P8TB79_9ASCO|nr:uncharacterized protein OGAPHI_000057 [Ogataea philodendri]KAH3671871.1 hypothetical protein OGAPHI_000057 [Ogataea philodendri]
MVTDLQKAVQDRNYMSVRYYMSREPKQLLQRDDDSRTPLHWACSLADARIVSDLLHCPECNFEIVIDDMADDSGWTPFHIACSVGDLETVKLLANFNPKPDVNLKTNSGQTALHFATSKQRYNVAEYLVVECRASSRIKDKRSQIPLHRAASVGSIKLCELLINKGNSPLNAQDSDGYTALHHALSEGHGELAVRLVKLGADFRLPDKDDKLPVEVAVDDKVQKFFIKSLQEEGLID